MIINPDNTNFNTSVAGAGSTTLANSTQTGNWMVELERAFMAEQPSQQESQNQDGNVGAQDIDINATSGNPQLENSIAQNQISPALSSSSDSTEPVNSESFAAKSVSQQNDNATESPTAAPQLKGPAGTGSGNVGEGKSVSSTSKNQAIGRTVTGKPKDSAIATGLASLPPAIAVTLADPVASGMGTIMQQVRQYQEMTSGGTGSITATLPAINSAVPALSMSIQMPDFAQAAQKAPEGLEEKVADSLPEANAETAQTTDTEQYPVRQMHMFQNENGVQAWIRDAGLSQPQAYAVGQALNSELRNSGLKLNTLVLNGKKVANLFQGNQYHEQDGLPSDNQQIDGTSNTTLLASQGANEKGVM